MSRLIFYIFVYYGKLEVFLSSIVKGIRIYYNRLIV